MNQPMMGLPAQVPNPLADAASSLITPGLQGAAPPVPGVSDVTQQMQQMGMQPMGAARVGNQLLNAVVGAQPPIMSDLDAPPTSHCASTECDCHTIFSR